MQSIEIQLTDGDKNVLTDYIKRIKSPNCYLEIGVFQGGSASIALESANPEIELFGVDMIDNFRLKDSRFNFILGYSVEVSKDWDKPIGVLFIDGNHDEAMQDFEAWEKFVVQGGYVLFHDYSGHSPKVIEDCNKIRENKNYKVIRVTGEDNLSSSIFIIKKL